MQFHRNSILTFHLTEKKWTEETDLTFRIPASVRPVSAAKVVSVYKGQTERIVIFGGVDEEKAPTTQVCSVIHKKRII